MQADQTVEIDERSIPLSSPAGYAHTVGRGWRRAAHLDYLNRKIVETATGRLRYLIVSMPPRHGKSELISRYTPAWYLGVFPQKRVILISYDGDTASDWGLKARQLTEEFGQKYFGISVDPASSARMRWDLSRADGGMRSYGIGGGVTGKGAHLFIVDDPIKNQEEALSEAHRKSMWDWWQSTAESRLEPRGSVIVVMTRWHEDDFAGRLINQLKIGKIRAPWEEINFPAIATEKDILGRKPGEALWPWRYPIEELHDKRAAREEYWWSTMYQGNPIPPGGHMFKRSWFEIVDIVPPWSKVAARVRFWDFAGGGPHGDYTVGTLISKTKDDKYYVEDVIREKFEDNELEAVFIQTLKMDGKDVASRIEQETGASGKLIIRRFANLAEGYDFEGIPSTEAKQKRWRPFRSQCQIGNVYLVRGSWNSVWLDEMQNVPGGMHDDQADSASGSYGALVNMKSSRGIVVI